MIQIPHEAVADFCERHGIQKLSLFGSAVRADFQPGSDVDVLIEFRPDRGAGLLGLARMEAELAGLLGRRVDLNTLGSLSPYFADEVRRQAVMIHDSTR